MHLKYCVFTYVSFLQCLFIIRWLTCLLFLIVFLLIFLRTSWNPRCASLTFSTVCIIHFIVFSCWSWCPAIGLLYYWSTFNLFCQNKWYLFSLFLFLQMFCSLNLKLFSNFDAFSLLKVFLNDFSFFYICYLLSLNFKLLLCICLFLCFNFCGNLFLTFNLRIFLDFNLSVLFLFLLYLRILLEFSFSIQFLFGFSCCFSLSLQFNLCLFFKFCFLILLLCFSNICL